ncbi:hypothetical protein HPP92_018886 [Vanilla planifolia]|uniref:Bulb-type lectin domain-containing protein n=1 Tax=Vanilla planifolia TaxID=51239 RepID=A0A835UK82_VANPL|nr:hypothetical protein HPP92_018886 [Vanilla planifolia]
MEIMTSPIPKAAVIFLTFLLAFDSATARCIMTPGETLRSGHSLSSGNSRLTMEKNCDLVIYHNKIKIWSSQSAQNGKTCFLYLQHTGVLSIVTNDGASDEVWKSHRTVPAHPNFYSINFVLEQNGVATIFSNSSKIGHCRVNGIPVWSTAQLPEASDEQKRNP